MNDLRIDPETVVWSLPEAERLDALRTRPLLVLMHGYGSFEGDLIQLAAGLPERFVFASPRAPLVAPAPIENGFSWFPLTQPGNPNPADLDRSAAAVLAWLDELDAGVQGGLGEIALLGFSQGGAMMTTLFRHRPDRFAAGVNCSGFSVHRELPGDARLLERRPPIFWGRDTADPIITQEAIARTAEWLPAHSSLTERLYPGIAHSISGEELRDIAAFLAEHVPGAAAASA
ncbi:alpha/beta hydrolase [Leucobacter sp. M11]|uniref:alpha/beta hydrolase n=1 Tax=Leucobacter sp. M11 TaxID=2993565 RepID=UPI002D7F7C15|nr:alpha/beta fold hydrolase [Leucobacter sp. M11]MEB4614352.1 hypothetical protein [Leucobacter sp. M11]